MSAAATLPPRDAPAVRATWHCSFAINGRFLTQPVTGVQRYARGVTGAMDAVLAGAGGRGRIVVPAGTTPGQRFAAHDVVRAGPLGGHAWEQTVLPARGGRRLLSLCNTGPLLSGEQVLCLHDANVFLHPDSYAPAFRLAYRALLPWLARRAGRIASVSKAAAAQIAAALPVRLRDIAVLPNGHEHAFAWNPDRSAIAPSLQRARPFVLLLGSRARHKNAALVLGLAGGLDALGLDLVVAGGRSGIFADLPAAGGPNVRLLGPVSDDDLGWLYRHALCLAFPSWTEGFGLPIVEAMALGCPVISSDRASMPEVCGPAALLAAPDDPSAWLGHVRALAGSRALREDLAGRGALQVRRFSWTASARGYLDLFGITA